MKKDTYWFFKKWGIESSESVFERLEQLENRVKVLEEENISLTNALYEIENALEARIDILTAEKWINNNV